MNARILSHQPDAEFFIDEQCYINELSNSGSDPSLSIAKARVKPGVSTRWHALKDTVERYVILAGTGRVEVGDLPAQDLGPHDVVIIPAGCRQRISTHSGAHRRCGRTPRATWRRPCSLQLPSQGVLGAPQALHDRMLPTSSIAPPE